MLRIDASVVGWEINRYRETWSDRSLLAEITENGAQSTIWDYVHHGMSDHNAGIQATSTGLASAGSDAVATVVGRGHISPQTVSAHAFDRERRCASARGI